MGCTSSNPGKSTVPSQMSQNTSTNTNKFKNDHYPNETSKHLSHRQDSESLSRSFSPWEHSFMTQTGYAPFQTKINQDAFVIQRCLRISPQTRISIYGVFDGHGESGHEVAQFIAHNLCTFIKLQSVDIINGEFRKAIHLAIKGLTRALKRSSIRTTYSGTTLTFIMRVSNEKIFVVNIGDSRAVMGRKVDSNNQFLAIPLSFDHKPETPAEKLRIVSKGGRVETLRGPPGTYCGPERVWLKHSDVPGLAMSRSIGDDVAHSVGVVGVPDILEYNLQESDCFIILASDGVWEFIESDEAVQIVGKSIKDDLNETARRLVKKSQKRWRKNEQVVDDITVVILDLG